MELTIQFLSIPEIQARQHRYVLEKIPCWQNCGVFKRHTCSAGCDVWRIDRISCIVGRVMSTSAAGLRTWRIFVRVFSFRVGAAPHEWPVWSPSCPAAMMSEVQTPMFTYHSIINAGFINTKLIARLWSPPYLQFGHNLVIRSPEVPIYRYRHAAVRPSNRCKTGVAALLQHPKKQHPMLSSTMSCPATFSFGTNDILHHFANLGTTTYMLSRKKQPIKGYYLGGWIWVGKWATTIWNTYCKNNTENEYY